MMRFVAALPCVHLAVFGWFVVRAYLSLGHWPRFDQPDPKALGFTLHYYAVWLTLMPALFSPIAILPGVIAFWRELRGSSRARRAACVYVAATAVVWIVWYTNLGGLAEWYGD